MFPTCPSFGSSLLEFGVVESKYEKAPRKTLTERLLLERVFNFCNVIYCNVNSNALMECQSLMFLDESHTSSTWIS